MENFIYYVNLVFNYFLVCYSYYSHIKTHCSLSTPNAFRNCLLIIILIFIDDYFVHILIQLNTRISKPISFYSVSEKTMTFKPTNQITKIL